MNGKKTTERREFLKKAGKVALTAPAAAMILSTSAKAGTVENGSVLGKTLGEQPA